MTLVASLPTPDAVAVVGDVSPEIDVIVWDGLTAAPEGSERIEFFVGRYDAPPPNADVLAGLPALRVVQLVSAGVEPWLDVVPSGIRLCSGRGVHGSSTAELAIAGMLAVLREMPRFEDARRAHHWDHSFTSGLAGRRVLVLGAGDIGTRVAQVVRILDAETTLVARSERPGVHTLDALPRLLPDSDIVVVAVPHTPETHRLVDAAFLAALPDAAVVVNVARGGIVDTDALLRELTGRRLFAYLDVTDPEPLPAEHPLWDAPNLVLTPHVGGGTRGWEQRAYSLVRDQLRRYQAGEPLANEVLHGY